MKGNEERILNVLYYVRRDIHMRAFCVSSGYWVLDKDPSVINKKETKCNKKGNIF